jgi:serine/threonine protein kinase
MQSKACMRRALRTATSSPPIFCAAQSSMIGCCSTLPALHHAVRPLTGDMPDWGPRASSQSWDLITRMLIETAKSVRLQALQSSAPDHHNTRTMHADSVAPLPNNMTSLPYTAPEIIQNVQYTSGAGASAVATGAADVWALGVIAFELLTGERVFPEGTTPDAIRAALIGTAPLPWCEGVEGGEEQRQRLRGLRRIVMPCLERSPSKRPTAEQLLQSWWHVFDEIATDWKGTFDTNVAVAAESTRADPTTQMMMMPPGTHDKASTT